ncbi:MAG: DUF6444 domain-containing protein [Acidobacteriia bacterium]|nr:DUF6444 domain-containing protein [Terriglobia bacterium]
MTPSDPPGRGWGRAQLRRRLQKVEQDNERLRQQNEHLQRQVEEFQEELGDKDKAIADRDKRIADLERQLASRKRNSTNSSKPPSSDGLAGAQRSRCSSRKKSGRKPGGQPGHMGHDRQSVENPDRIEEVLAEKCKHCGTPLPQASGERQTVGDVFRRQIVDLPEVIVPVVTEYQYPKLVCPCCWTLRVRTPSPAPFCCCGSFPVTTARQQDNREFLAENAGVDEMDQSFPAAFSVASKVASGSSKVSGASASGTAP